MTPTGVVTFLMTDVQGSTRLWDEHPDIAGSVIARHDELIGATVAERGGQLVRSKGEGDSTFSVFAHPTDALLAAVDVQRVLQRERWPAGISLRVRAAVSTGATQVRDGDYHGITPNRGARLRGIVHGGQTVCCQQTRDLAHLELGTRRTDVTLVDLGPHRLRDISRAERVFQVVHPDLPRDFPPLLSLGTHHNLPPDRDSFLGRDRELASIRTYLRRSRLVTLVGVGGCGKTRLAIKAASQSLDGFADGVFFIDLVPVSDGAALPSAVARAVGFPRRSVGAASGHPWTEVIDHLSTRCSLLVFDNCEHVIDGCASLIDEVVERCPSVSVLATSREALDLNGEQVVPVPALGLARGPELGSDAAQLFAARAALVRPDFATSPDEARMVEEICGRLDGLPLAIELAAAQAAHLSPHQIHERLGDRFRLLTSARRGPPRHHALQAALDWSYDLLDDDERVALRRMAVFPGSFSLPAADAVCGGRDAPALLRSLVRKSMVVAVDTEGDRRFRLLETVRAYAQQRLEDAGELNATRDRHRDHFLAWTESLAPSTTYLDPDGVIRRERDDLQAALAWSLADGRHDLVGRIASTMTRIWLSDVVEGHRWLSIGSAAVEAMEREHRTRVLAVSAQLAVFAIDAFDGSVARRAVEVSEGRPGIWSSLAHSLLCLNTGIHAFVTKDQALVAETDRLGRLAVDLAEGPLSRGLAWFWVGQARVLVDDLDGAIDALERGSIEVVPGGDVSVISLAQLAMVLHVRGRHEEALEAALAVFPRAQAFLDSGLWAWVVYCSLPYALELGHLDRHAEALAFVRDLLDDSDAMTTPGVMTSVVVVLAALAQMRGDLALADLLLRCAGEAIIWTGARSTVDVALHTYYFEKVSSSVDGAVAARNTDRAARTDLAAAVRLGVDG